VGGIFSRIYCAIGGSSEMTVGKWVLSGGGFFVSFFPWGLVRAIAWVIEVFKNQNKI